MYRVRYFYRYAICRYARWGFRVFVVCCLRVLSELYAGFMGFMLGRRNFLLRGRGEI